MNILFEEAGSFKAASVLADNNTALQVELPGGKRSKVKVAHVLLRFAQPGPAELLQRAQTLAQDMEADFLWQAGPEEEFDFKDFALDYVGHPPDAVEAAAVLFGLFAAPMYFHRKGRGRFRRAPPEILQAALAGLEKKKQQAAAQARMTASLLNGELPPEFTPLLPELLYQPDRNKGESKALEAACAASGKTALALFAACGVLSDSHAFHFGRFMFHHFPQGADFPAHAPAAFPQDLPHATVNAFSIDDAQTTEIDDAFSLSAGKDGSFRVGIHIAAPGLGFAAEHDLGKIARQRLSTVYMPGRKLTMLPPAVVDQFTLAAGRVAPAISLYLDVAPDFTVRSRETRIETLTVAANLRHHDIEPWLTPEALAAGQLPDHPFAPALARLWRLAEVLAAGRKAAPQLRKEYIFAVDWSRRTAQGEGHITLSERPRGSPLDTLVAELMIVANATWGATLRDAQIPALYRVQTDGKVRMTTQAGAHEGLGVDCYAWSSSPLRRYCDLLNQWQLLAWLRGEKPPLGSKSAALFAALRDFELTYAAYADFQKTMERYWCLRWLLQENVREISGQVLRDNLLRCDTLPLVLAASGMPALTPGTPVRVRIEAVDLLEAQAQAVFLASATG